MITSNQVRLWRFDHTRAFFLPSFLPKNYSIGLIQGAAQDSKNTKALRKQKKWHKTAIFPALQKLTHMGSTFCAMYHHPDATPCLPLFFEAWLFFLNVPSVWKILYLSRVACLDRSRQHTLTISTLDWAIAASLHYGEVIIGRWECIETRSVNYKTIVLVVSNYVGCVWHSEFKSINVNRCG